MHCGKTLIPPLGSGYENENSSKNNFLNHCLRTPLKVSKRSRGVQEVHHVIHKINPARANLEGLLCHFSGSPRAHGLLAVSIMVLIDETGCGLGVVGAYLTRSKLRA
jgi:hypothetical protein